MEVLSVAVTLCKCQTFSFQKPNTTRIHELPVNVRLPHKINHFNLSSYSCNWSITRVAATTYPSFNSTTTQNRHWMVVMDTPPQGLNSKPQLIDYYVNILQTVIGRYLMACALSRTFLFSWKLFWIWFRQWERCSDVYIWCFMGHPLRFLLWHWWRNILPAGQ